MKKALLTVAFLLCTMVASAQFYAGGSLGFWHNSDAETTSYSVTPDVGYVLNDNVSIGIGLGIEYAEADGIEMTGAVVNPYLRYTFFKAGPVSLFADGAFEFASIKPEEVDAEVAWGIGIKPGIAYALNQRFTAVAHLGFLGYRDADEMIAPLYEPGFGLAFSNNISFSLYYSF